MNICALVGRLTRDVDMRTGTGDNATSIARFTLAVDRGGKKVEGQPTADFISCIAFGKTADFIGKYFGKGQRLGCTGRISTGHYTDKNGVEKYTTDVIVDRVEFVDSKASSETSGTTTPKTGSDAFMNIPDNASDELPFA